MMVEKQLNRKIANIMTQRQEYETQSLDLYMSVIKATTNPYPTLSPLKKLAVLL